MFSDCVARTGQISAFPRLPQFFIEWRENPGDNSQTMRLLAVMSSRRASRVLPDSGRIREIRMGRRQDGGCLGQRTILLFSATYACKPSLRAAKGDIPLA